MTTHAYVPFVRDPTDVVGRRIAALFIDWGIAFVMLIALALSLGETREFGSIARAEAECERINELTNDFCIPVNDIIYVYDGGDVAAMFLLPLLYAFLNDALLTGVTGFSIGKGLVGLRVIRQSDGRLCGIGRSTARWVMWIADAQPCGLPLVGLITGLVSKGHRRVGDMVAGTLVVDKRDVGVVPVVPGLTAMPAAAPTPWGAPAPQWGAPPQAPPAPWGPPPQAPPAPWGAPPQAPPPPTPPQWGPPGAPPQWGTPAPPPPWQQPNPEPQWQQPSWDQPSPVASPQHDAPAPATPGVDGPMWDDARDTYIQWDPDLSEWVQWDEISREWRPIV